MKEKPRPYSVEQYKKDSIDLTSDGDVIPAQEQICTGCGTLKSKELGKNHLGEDFLACCPDSSFVDFYPLETTKTSHKYILNSNELRVGNILYFPFTKELIEVLGINAIETNNGIINTISFKNGLNLYCEKISLLEKVIFTELHLIKSGGNKLSYYTFVYGRFNLEWKKSYNYWYITDSENYCYMTKIQFLHEWQNFIYMMDGNELTINFK